MKTLPGLLLLISFAGCAYAQVPAKSIRRDSLPKILPPSVDSPDINSLDQMPNARPNNSFYRNPMDPPNVVRATLDNMPIKVPDSSTHYKMLRSFQQYVKPDERPMPSLKLMPRIVPKKFK